MNPNERRIAVMTRAALLRRTLGFSKRDALRLAWPRATGSTRGIRARRQRDGIRSVKLHEDLGVAEDADEAAIRAAHRSLVKRHHPDQKGGDEATFKRIQHAYDVLSDPDKRAHYERTGDDGSATPVDDTRGQAMALLSGIVIQIAESEQAGLQDFVADARNRLRQALTTIKSQFEANEKRAARFERNRRRWKRKAGGDDVLAPMFDAQAREIVRIGEGLAKAETVHTEALKLLEGYEYEVDPRTAPTGSPLFAGQTRADFQRMFDAS
ncbi:MAG: DnaJ domain-containing protein [Patescibacteria group bacterium]|nr:DnaJ domain-containing protein [Patescibacteria group bacterium]